jgi:glutamate-ammonia-ligase adenylyltransferase
MQLEQLRHTLDSLPEARSLLSGWGLRDPERGRRNLLHLADALGLETLADLSHPLGRLLPRCPDADMALNNFERFLAGPAHHSQIATLLEGRARTLETVLQLFSVSQFFSDLLIANPDYLDMLRIPLRSSPSRGELLDELQSEVDAAYDDAAVMRILRRFRQKQMLRIGTNDIIRDRPLEEITRDISRVADTALEVALAAAIRMVSRRYGEPFTSEGEPARCVILAFGKLGGKELNYSSDIDLMFLFD